MKILFATSEAHPFAKTGGLADMVSSLALALSREGHDVVMVLPRYYGIDRSSLEQLPGAMGVPVGGGEEWCAVYQSSLGGGAKKHKVRVYFIDHERFFGRDGIYGSPSEPDFLDNPRRFIFFSRSVFQLCRKIGWFPDIVHAHDWPTAMVPVFLAYGERQWKEGGFSETSSVLTIHNLGYQGVYSKDNFYYSGLGWDTFYSAGFDDWNMMNLLKAGINTADRVNTVSPHYAEETRSGAQGFRLDGVLRYRGSAYSGILNGIDTSVWNPKTDAFLPAQYSVKDMAGKAQNKAALQRAFGLPEEGEVPLIGMVTRMVEQKGVGELFGPGYGCAWSICADMKVQLLILGTGEAWCENEVMSLSSRLGNFKAKVGYNESLSHLVEAGSDFFLMPSRYEPSGLNQMYSLVYGTLPIVRNTGGLYDTEENYNQEKGTGTGFMFDDLNPQAIYNTVGWAVWAYYNRREQIEAMRLAAMTHNFSWDESARKYLALYTS